MLLLDQIASLVIVCPGCCPDELHMSGFRFKACFKALYDQTKIDIPASICAGTNHVAHTHLRYSSAYPILQLWTPCTSTPCHGS